MSTPLGAAIARVVDTLKLARPEEITNNTDVLAADLVAAIHPQITDARQFLGVPEGSIVAEYWLGAMRPPYTWEGGKLHRRANPIMLTPEELLKGPGEVYVLWTP
jgi:hypothetical protein